LIFQVRKVTGGKARDTNRITGLFCKTWKLTFPNDSRQQILTDDSSYRRSFDPDNKNEIHYHSWKEHLKMSEIAKFGCELL
jgi:hypothetical protein